MKIISGALFLTLASYIGFSLYNTAKNPFLTTAALRYTVEELGSAEGYIVREEERIAGDGSVSVPAVRDGVRTASGALLANVYAGASSLAGASEIRETKLRIAQLEAAASANPRDAEEARQTSVLKLAAAVQAASFERLDELALAVESLVIGAHSGGAAEEELALLREKLARSEASYDAGIAVYAPKSGLFTSSVDGLEDVTPGALTSVLPSSLASLFSSPEPGGGVGKLIFGTKWYFAAVLDASDALRLHDGDQVRVQLTRPVSAGYAMTVERVGRGENGKSVVVFSCDRGLAETAALRYVSAEVVFDEVSGVRVPKAAIHLEDGEDGEGDNLPYVYLATGGRAERVAVTILREYGDGYIVTGEGGDASPLREGAEIIVKANGLENGKALDS
ncbi:MAG: hypothetical protein LBT12_08475 [Oscillospiraceae bacterium]|nr:hypothetical protein [Oscillospiraceae bacterium]